MPNLWKKVPKCLEKSEVERKIQPNNKEKTKAKFAMVQASLWKENFNLRKMQKTLEQRNVLMTY
jgi:hypothetical protein